MAVGIEREEGVAMHIHHIGFRFECNLTTLGQGQQLRQRIDANREREVIELLF